MTRMLSAALVAALFAAGGCDRIGLTPPPAESAPAPVAAPATSDLRPHVGDTYAAFAAGQPQYAPEALGLTGADATRFSRAMARPMPAWTTAGGGAEALVLTGCASEGCDVARGVVAVDLATGGAFVGVSDENGSSELAPNNRVEVLLRLSAPSGRWDDAQPADAPPETAAP